MTDPLDLIRGDRVTLDLAGLLDADDAPASFNVGDVLTFTAKFHYGDPDEDAFLQISGGSIVTSGDSATIAIVGSDWATTPVPRDRPFVWDVQLSVNGDPDQIVTLDRGVGILQADTTLTA